MTTFPALLRRVLDDVREDTALGRGGGKANGKAATNGDAKRVNGASSSADRPSLAVPEAVISEALKATRESLEAVCELGEESSS